MPRADFAVNADTLPEFWDQAADRSFSPGFVSGQPVPPGEKADGVPVTIQGIVPVKVSAEI